MSDYYSEIVPSYDELYGEEQLKKLDVIAQYIDPEPPLLDIGAGTGISTRFFNVEAVALDPSEKMLKKYKGKSVVGNAENIPFPDNSFNTIISVTSLHHVKNLDLAIREIKRVAKPKCKFAFTILKKAKNFCQLKTKLLKAFNLLQVDEEKDLILVSQKG
ncbi:MAG: class I SAM-dependent methyltransferase [Nanoarchaeota archaeon]|nr:class I SAM-dependent methyltransferase [Nanoarchaeota archaeon]